MSARIQGSTFVVQAPGYPKQHPLWSLAYEAAMLDCIQRAKQELGPDVSNRAIAADQLPVANMMDSAYLFLWQMTDTRVTSFQEKHDLPVEVQLEYGRIMARLQCLKCVSSREAGDWQDLSKKWRSNLHEVVTPGIWNATLRFSDGQAPREEITSTRQMQRCVDRLIGDMQEMQYPAMRESFLAGQYHQSIVDCLFQQDFGEVIWPNPPATVVETGQGPVDLHPLIPPDLSRTPFAAGITQRTAVAAHLGARLLEGNTDFGVTTLDISNIALVKIPCTNILALSGEPTGVVGGPTCRERIKHWLCVVALCILFQVGHSVRQDNSTVERWIDLLDRFNSWETREHIWRKMIRNVHEVLLAELPATLVEIASQVELGELESLILAMRPHESVVSWLVNIKRAAATPFRASQLANLDFFLPTFPWLERSIGDPVPADLLVQQALPMLQGILRYIHNCVEQSHAIDAIQMHYERSQVIVLLCFLFLQAYRPLAVTDWTGIAAGVIARALVEAVWLLEADVVSIFSISLSHVVSAEIGAQIWENRSRRLGTDSPTHARSPRRLLPRASTEGPLAVADDAAVANAPQRSSRLFIQRAHSALRRLDIDKTDPLYYEEAQRIYVFMSEAFAEDPFCPDCGVEMVPISRSSVYGPHTRLPAMVSLDAIHPRSDGGDYANGNMRIVDIGCNCVKLNFTADEAMVLIAHLGAERCFDVDANGMLCPPTKPRVDPERMNTAVIEAWAKRCLAHNRRHAVQLTVAQLVQVVKKFMITETMYRDPSGSELPLAVASLDRIDPRKIYTEDNVRPLLTGLNLLRAQCVNDASIIAYLQQISPAAICKGKRLEEEQHVALPFSDWGDRILRRGDLNDMGPLPLETAEASESRLEEEEADAVGDESLEGREDFEGLLANW